MIKNTASHTNCQNVAQSFFGISNETRLNILTYLAKNEASKIDATALCNYFNLAPNKLNFHMSHLIKADLVNAEKSGRHIYYSANLMHLNKVLQYVMYNCFGAIDIKYRVSRPARSRSG